MKGLFQSKTVWFNIFTAVVAIFALPQVMALIGAENAVLIVAVANVLLRVFTTTGVSVKAPMSGTGSGTKEQ